MMHGYVADKVRSLMDRDVDLSARGTDHRHNSFKVFQTATQLFPTKQCILN